MGRQPPYSLESSISLDQISSYVIASSPSVLQSIHQTCNKMVILLSYLQIICTSHEACSTDGVRVIITDSCCVASCAGGASLFDMTGHTFRMLAQLDRPDELRAIGLVAVHYKP
ncbi:expansin-B18-like [Panicum miliaceum]|uniref:Expansin-B18-like n=1 Tax=Panicum miliaceum TaxID=4540 RepID=A0A3L6REK4_PANMI|nr:expansin-B18-like [Panicum miliaceum]